MIENSAQIIVEKIVQMTDLIDRRVLEIGCGGGRITSLLAAHAKQLVAIDPDLDSMIQARTEAPAVDFQLARGEELPFFDISFDLVVFTLSLHHQDSDAALSEAARVLKGDGRILVVEPAEDGEVEQFFTLVHNETPAKQSAQRAIKQSNLILEWSEIFSATWVFANRDELCRSLFSYYDMPYDPKVVRKITDHLGARRDASPLRLKDTLSIQSLSQPS